MQSYNRFGYTYFEIHYILKLVKFWMNYEDMVWKIRIGDVWSHDTYVHETNPLIWTLNTKFLFEFLALLTLKFEYIGKMVYK